MIGEKGQPVVVAIFPITRLSPKCESRVWLRQREIEGGREKRWVKKYAEERRKVENQENKNSWAESFCQ